MLRYIKTMLPVLPNAKDPKLQTLLYQFTQAAAGLGKGLQAELSVALGEWTTNLNSYYSNAMEGNPSKIKDIEAALNKHFSSDPSLRDYQKEHLAHIAVQKQLLLRLRNEPDLNICSQEFLCWLHYGFYSRLPKSMHFTSTISGKQVPIKAGELRSKPVQVGQHIPPQDRQEVERYLKQFSELLNPDSLALPSKLLGLASSHHRLLWIHPFADGNGRVARLFTLAYMVKCGLDVNLWTVTRAFARERKRYDTQLALADQPRLGHVDGRGPLSEKNLRAFCLYFFAAGLDQIQFMASHLQLGQFEQRYVRYLNVLIQEKTLSKSGFSVMQRLMRDGKILRGQVRDIAHVQERRANQVIKELLSCGLVQSPSPRGALHLHITSDVAAVLFPKLV